jgi:inorganic triphosphatase YgiF
MPQFELKLASTPNEMPHLKQSLLEMAGEGHATCRKSFDTYYDTADDELRREGFILMVGKRDGHHVQQVSTKEAWGMTPLVAGVWEDVIEGERPNPWAPNSGAHLPIGLDYAELRARFTTRVRRTLFALKPDASTQIEGALDEGEIRTSDGKSVDQRCRTAAQGGRSDGALRNGVAPSRYCAVTPRDTQQGRTRLSPTQRGGGGAAEPSRPTAEP